jgi:hypothetical protein
MTAVVCQHGTIQCMSTGQNVRVGGLAPAIVLHRQYVMSQPAQFLDRRARKILIGVELHPGSPH